LLGSCALSSVRLALPKGRLLPATACLLREAGLEFNNYTESTRIYRLESSRYPFVSAKIFQERDIPVQVAVGNYDLGICGLDWIEELVSKYPASALVKVLDLQYGRGGVYVVSSKFDGIQSFQGLMSSQRTLRIVTEYPNLAERMALRFRLRNFRVFPIWGAGEVYPPENADVVLLWAEDEVEVAAQSLVPLKTLFQTSAFLVANKNSWETKELGQVVGLFSDALSKAMKPWQEIRPNLKRGANNLRLSAQADKIWLALPDGHQQAPTQEFLGKAGLRMEGYSPDILDRRPRCTLDWVYTKVIRPQDMPLQVANGGFDLAITGEDWLLDHVCRFPSSPVVKLLDLGFGQVRVVAVTSQSLPVSDIADLRHLAESGRLSPIRVASEYVNIADKYLRDNHFSRYRLIPTWGASEAFLPEDADLLIENTQTGKTLLEHNLKVVDTIFESAACLIGNRDSVENTAKKKKIVSLVEAFRRATKVS